jgi:HEAT repeat protein
MGDEQAIEGLITALRDEFDLGLALRKEVAAVLAKNSDQAVGPLLNAVLNDEGWYPDTIIADMMVETGGTDIVVPLIEGLRDADKDVPVRNQIAYMLGELGDKRAIPALVSALEPGVGPWRSAAYALQKIYENDAEKLLPLLKQEETVTVYIALVDLGESGTEEALITALQDYGYKKMAETYLNCGNERLEEAARAWADAHGYSTMSMPTGGAGPKWGTE